MLWDWKRIRNFVFERKKKRIEDYNMKGFGLYGSFLRLTAWVVMTLGSIMCCLGENTVSYSVSDSIVPSGLPTFVEGIYSNGKGDRFEFKFDLISSEPFVVHKLEWVNLDTIRQPVEAFYLDANEEAPSGKSIAWHITVDFPYTHVLGRYDHLKIYTDKGVITNLTNESGFFEQKVNDLTTTFEEYVGESERSVRKYIYLAVILIFLVLVLVIVLLLLRNRNMRIQIQYRKALDDIALLKKALSSDIREENLIGRGDGQGIQPEKRSAGNVAMILPEKDNACMVANTADKNTIREILKKELLALQQAGQVRKEVSQTITSSAVYGRLKEYVRAEKVIPENDEIWTNMEEVILKQSPEFKTRLYLLTGDKLKEDAYRMTLLIKYGMNPTELSILLGRTKGAISSRRGYTCEMIFGQKLGAKVMDDIIRLL